MNQICSKKLSLHTKTYRCKSITSFEKNSRFHAILSSTCLRSKHISLQSIFEAQNSDMFHPSTPYDPAGDVMRHYQENSSDAEFVSLKHYEIKDLVPVLGHLASLVNMNTLILSDNLLTRLPEDMSALQNLETLDLSRNPFPNVAVVIRGLFSLPKLRHLSITLPEEDEDQLVATLVHLKSLNGVALDIEARPSSPSRRDQAANAQSLLQSLRHGTDVDVPRGYAASSRKIVDHGLEYHPWNREHVEPLNRLQNAVRVVSGNLSNPEEYSDLVGLVEGHVRARTRNEPDRIRALTAQFLGKSLLVEYSFDELVRSAAKYGPQVADALHETLQAHVDLISEASKLIAAFQEDRDVKIEALQEDLAKEILEKERNFFQSSEDLPRFVDPPVVSVQASSAVPYQHDVSSPVNTDRRGLKPPPDVMPLDELRALLKVFFDSKRRYDEANASAKLPEETVEQHIYTFLFGRTSNNEEIKKTIASLFTSLRFYGPTELDVEVFSLILRHECDEGYWAVFNALKSKVFDSIQSVLPTNSGQSWDGFVAESKARDVVALLIPPAQQAADHETLQRSVTRSLVRNEENGSGNQYHIGYSALGTVILRFFVAAYLSSIRQVYTQFRQVDPERSGVIGHQRVRTLLSHLFPGIASSRALEIMALADPHETGVITFSTVVKVFSAITSNAYSSRSGGGTSKPFSAAGPGRQSPSSRPSVAKSAADDHSRR
jgi:hypothetical protein